MDALPDAHRPPNAARREPFQAGLSVCTRIAVLVRPVLAAPARAWSMMGVWLA